MVGWIFMNRSFMGYQMKVAGQARVRRPLRGLLGQALRLDRHAGGRRHGRHRRHLRSGRSHRPDHRAHLPGLRLRGHDRGLRGPPDPIGIFFSSLLMALLYMGGEQAQQYLNLPSSISKVFQGMLLFFLLGSDVFINFRPRLVRRRK
jgi:ABC-type uncharacterized transport system permease subunit